MTCSEAHRSVLLGIAHESISSGLQNGMALDPVAGDYPAELLEIRASFVTLKQDDMLRGCIGTLEASTRLVNSVADNAYAAAFRDPRFPALTRPELDGLTIDISVLGPLQPLEYESESDLLAVMQAGREGWVIQEHGARGTFLPSVWDSLPDARRFLDQLKLKAGLAKDYWSDSIEVWRYTSESFSAHTRDLARHVLADTTSGQDTTRQT